MAWPMEVLPLSLLADWFLLLLVLLLLLLLPVFHS